MKAIEARKLKGLASSAMTEKHKLIGVWVSDDTALTVTVKDTTENRATIKAIIGNNYAVSPRGILFVSGKRALEAFMQ